MWNPLDTGSGWAFHPYWFSSVILDIFPFGRGIVQSHWALYRELPGLVIDQNLLGLQTSSSKGEGTSWEHFFLPQFCVWLAHRPLMLKLVVMKVDTSTLSRPSIPGLVTEDRQYTAKQKLFAGTESTMATFSFAPVPTSAESPKKLANSIYSRQTGWSSAGLSSRER